MVVMAAGKKTKAGLVSLGPLLHGFNGLLLKINAETTKKVFKYMLWLCE